MTEANPSFVHPLFDPASRYRLSSTDCVWGTDDGRTSVRDYFLARYRQELREEWQNRETPLPQDWGYNPQINALLHECLLDARAETEEEARSVTQSPPPRRVPTATEGLMLPALWRFDLRTANVTTPTAERDPDWMFTGLAARDRARGHDRFKVDVPRVPDQHRALVLLVTQELIEKLATVLNPASETEDAAKDSSRLTAATDTDVADVLGKTLDSRMLEPDAPATAAVRQRANRLARLLSCAAGLEGETAEGHFRADVTLPRACPALGLNTWLVFCLGPRSQA